MKPTKLFIALAIFLSQYAYAQTPDFTEAFTTTWKTTTSGDSISIPTRGGSDVTDYNFWIDWGDMTQPENVMGDDPDPPHTYDTAGTFTVQITGTFPHFYLNNSSAIRDKLLSVEQWGDIAWESMANTFYGASNLTLNATDTPILSGVTDMNSMFQNASAFNQDISGWNVSSVTNMNSMFQSASAFNQDIGDWNVSSVTNMQSMFASASVFNQDIGDWNVSGVSDMSFMFASPSVFNQDIGDWNVDSVTSMRAMFSGAAAFNQDIGGWDVSGVTDMNRMFSRATVFNQDIGEWKVDSVTNMGFMFRDARVFNQDLSGWNVSKVTNMGTMLNNSGLSTYHYEELLIAWNKLELEENVPLGAAGRQYRARAKTARDSLTSPTDHSWTITGDALKAENDALVVVGFSDLILPQGFSSYKIPINSLFTDADGDPFIFSVTTSGDMAIDATFANDMLTLTEMGAGVDSVMMTATDTLGVQIADTFLVTLISFDSAFIISWRTTTANDFIGIPTTDPDHDSNLSSAYDFYVDWGDKSPVTRIMGFQDGDSSHVYAAADTYEIKITGTYPAFRLAKNPKRKNLVSVDQWGNIAWESMQQAFFDANNLMLNATDTPDFSGVTDMSRMFREATLSGNMNHWNVSSVTNMDSMFFAASTFNQDIGDWNVSSVTSMIRMFTHATVFNQDIGDWNVSGVTSMMRMFQNAFAFNQDIGDWNVDRVTDMSNMFNAAIAFNQDIGDWNVSKVTNMNTVFSRATVFNQDIGGWNVSNVRDMNSMFNEADAFNQDIGDWNVDSVRGMVNMFSAALVFNQDIGDWNVSKVTNMGNMLSIATAFNQDLSGWNVSGVTNMTSMFDDSGLSTYHYEELLIAWNKLELQKNVRLGAGGRKYRARAQTARDSLMDIHKWTITGDGFKAGNDVPIVVGFSDLVLSQGFPSREIPINSLFTDGERDPLTLSIVTGGDMAITATLGEDSLTLILTETGLGVDSIIITATDGFSPQVADTFYVSVVSFDSAFITTWKTTIPNEPIGIPINEAGDDPTVLSPYDFYVDWGDKSDLQRIIGAEDPNSSHIYATAGTYQIKITGTYPAFRLVGNPKGVNLVSVDQWGNIAWESMAQAFYGADTLMIKATDAPNLSGVTVMKDMFRELAVLNGNMNHWDVSNVENMDSMFRNTSVFNQDISGWNVSSVTSMNSMFQNAFTFNEDISSWDVSKVTMMSNMLDSSGLSTYHYEELLIAWDTLELQEDVTLGAADIQYRARAQVAHDSLTSDTDHNWTITDAGLKENDTPTSNVPLPDLLFLESFGSFPIPINSLFTDGDGDPLTLSVTTDGDMVITAVLGEDSLTLTESGRGVASVIITARDEFRRASSGHLPCHRYFF